jgi:peptide chain release factor 1
VFLSIIAFNLLIEIASPVVLHSSKITPPLESKLLTLSQRHDDLLTRLNSNTLTPSDLTQASKELSQLTAPKTLFDDWLKHRNDLGELQQMLSVNSDDEDMVAMAKEEFTDIMTQIHDLERQLITELAPKDAADDASAILEIRSGAGGDEASIFSADMARMYERFAQLQRWKWEVLSQSDEQGGKGFKVLYNTTHCAKQTNET